MTPDPHERATGRTAPVPAGVHVAAAWSWRILLVVGALAVAAGIDEVRDWLLNGPLSLGDGQLDKAADPAIAWLSDNNENIALAAAPLRTR